MSIAITINSNVTVLVPQNVICFGYFVLMSHGVNKKVLTIVSLYPGLFVLQEILYQLFFCCDLTDYCKNNAFSK